MTIKKNQQKIQIFRDNTEIIGEIKVLIDTAEDWLSIVYFGDKLTMSLKNWESLVELVEVTKTKSL